MKTNTNYIKSCAYLGLSFSQLAYAGSLLESGHTIQAICYAALSVSCLIEIGPQGGRSCFIALTAFLFNFIMITEIIPLFFT